MSEIADAKERLPLPALLHQLGFGKHAKKSARCPFHDDKHNSFSIWKNGANLWFWKCHAGCGEGDEITFLELHENISQRDAIKRFLEMASVNGATPPRKVASTSTSKSTLPLDWQACVKAFTDKHVQWIAKWRGYSIEFCRWLKENGLVGLYNGGIAFPVHDRAGNVVACHYRLKDGSWRYYPQGAKVRPLVIGELAAGDPVQDFESYFDAFSFMNVYHLRGRIIITRGAGNDGLVAGLSSVSAIHYAWKQNDELKNGKRAGDDWLKDVKAHAGAKVLCPKIPEQFKDLNDWTRAGATSDDLRDAMVEAQNAAAIEAQEQADNLASLFNSICAFLSRYVVFQMPEQAQVLALWVAHCWTLDAFDYTPYPYIFSPEKQCGKTRLLDCLELLTPKPWRAILPSEAVLFRKIESDKPTLLLDEVDGIFGGNGKDDRSEALRCLLNAGFEEKAQVPRCVGQGTNQEVKNFAVFCPKALAGIGKLPDTVRDRAVPIQLVRRARDENVERFRKREAERETSVIRSDLEAWSKALGITAALRGARPSLPDALSDRQQDICEPLLAIADIAGGDWPERARAALVALCSQTDDNQSLGIKLLSDIRQVFDSAKCDKISTLELLKALVELETDGPWANWWEADLKNGNRRGPAQKLAKLLGAYKIKPDVIRLQDGSTPRGYRREDFLEAWKRYLPANGLNNATTQHSDELSL